MIRATNRSYVAFYHNTPNYYVSVPKGIDRSLIIAAFMNIANPFTHVQEMCKLGGLTHLLDMGVLGMS